MRRPFTVGALALLALPVAAVAAWEGASAVRRRRLRRRDPAALRAQTLADGTGPLFRRVYRLDLPGATLSAEAVMARVQADPDAFAPHAVARFEKTGGAPGRLAVGDTFFVHIAGPWDGPVRVTALTPTAFALATLAGHLEAGAIRFEVRPRPGGGLRAEITSCARSAGGAVHVAYDVVRLARGAQTAMWTGFLTRIGEAAGGPPPGDVVVRTYRAAYDDPLTGADAEVPAPAAALLDDLARRALNFEPPTDPTTPGGGWHHADDATDLLPEPPGPPLEDGVFARAKAFVQAYRFPDPRRIVGVYDPEAALGERTMLLRARFLGLGFRFGVRVVDPFDEVRPTPEGPVHAWGYGYRTLDGHFEQGQITFELTKTERTGAVRFRMHSYSRRGRIANPFYRVGMWALGRPLQRQFVHRALARTARYVEESLVRDACLKGDARAARLLR